MVSATIDQVAVIVKYAKIFDESETPRRVCQPRFLVSSYQHKYYYWEVVEMLRKVTVLKNPP